MTDPAGLPAQMRDALMNASLDNGENGIDSIERHFDFLARQTQTLLALEREA